MMLLATIRLASRLKRLLLPPAHLKYGLNGLMLLLEVRGVGAYGLSPKSFSVRNFPIKLSQKQAVQAV
jgi:hypothetical protein